MLNRVLVIATSAKTRGGITSVINIYKKNKIWNKYSCVWIETHIDSGFFLKIYYFLRSILKFSLYIYNSKIIHIHLSLKFSLLRKFFFIIIAKYFKKKIIIHFHSPSDKTHIKKNHLNIYKYIFRYADKIIVLSNSWKKSIALQLEINEDKIIVLSNPCKNIVKKNKIRKKEILFAGTLNERKNYKTLIKAFAVISHDYPDWSLVIAGNGEIEVAKKISTDLNIQEKVSFTGWVSGSEKDKIFSNASIFCLPSFSEGFPMAILDAWSYELPVIATPVGGIIDFAVNKKNMLLFNPKDYLELSKNLSELISDKNLYGKLAIASKNFKFNIFSEEKIIKSLDNIYQNLLDE